MISGSQNRQLRIVARGRDSVRIEQTGHEQTITILRPDGTATRNATGEWSFEPVADKAPSFGGKVSFRMGGPVGGPHAFGLMSMLDSSALLGSCRFKSAEAVQLNGRSAIRSSGRVQTNFFPIGRISNGLQPGTARVELAVDLATGIVLRREEHSDAGLVSSRALHIESVDGSVDDSSFELPPDVESTKESRRIERFDDLLTLAASLDFPIYVLDPPPPATRLLCMRDSANQARITYLPGFQAGENGRFFQPSSVTSTRPQRAETHDQGEGWQRAEVQGKPARIWTVTKDEQVRSHVRIVFEDAEVEFAGALSAAETLRLAGTLRRV